MLIIFFFRTAYNIYQIPKQLRKAQETLEKAMAKHQKSIEKNKLLNGDLDETPKIVIDDNIDDESGKNKDL